MEPTPLTSHQGRALSPDTSPDGRYASYIVNTPSRPDLDSHPGHRHRRRPCPSRSTVPASSRSSVSVGTYPMDNPTAAALAFIGAERTRPGRRLRCRTSYPDRTPRATLRPLAGFSAEFESESFAISPDGRHLALSGRSPDRQPDVGRRVAQRSSPMSAGPLTVAANTSSPRNGITRVPQRTLQGENKCSRA